MADAASRTGDAIKEGAAKADSAIQSKLGNGVDSSPSTVPSEQSKP